MCPKRTAFIRQRMFNTALMWCSFHFTHATSTTSWTNELIHNERNVEKGCFLLVITKNFRFCCVIKELEFGVNNFSAITFDLSDPGVAN